MSLGCLRRNLAMADWSSPLGARNSASCQLSTLGSSAQTEAGLTSMPRIVCPHGQLLWLECAEPAMCAIAGDHGGREVGQPQPNIDEAHAALEAAVWRHLGTGRPWTAGPSLRLILEIRRGSSGIAWIWQWRGKGRMREASMRVGGRGFYWAVHQPM
jgi:hypothetical protein